MKKLYRSKTNKVFGGIVGGIGEYLELDPVLLRVLFVILSALTGFFPGLVGYLVCLFIVPKHPG